MTQIFETLKPLISLGAGTCRKNVRFSIELPRIALLQIPAFQYTYTRQAYCFSPSIPFGETLAMNHRFSGPIRLVYFSLALSLLSGCADLNKQAVGTGVGAIVGGLGGSQVGNGKGKTAATAVGVLAGAVIGNQIGKYLDDKDRAEANAATQRALDSGRSQTWSNPDSGASGQIKVINPGRSSATSASKTSQRPISKNPYQQPAATQLSTASTPSTVTASTAGRTCKTIRQTITLKDGSTHEEDVTACKGPNGWENV